MEVVTDSNAQSMLRATRLLASGRMIQVIAHQSVNHFAPQVASGRMCEKSPSIELAIFHKAGYKQALRQNVNACADVVFWQHLVAQCR